MSDAWIERWNERYGKEEFAYGTEPNKYLSEQLMKVSPGRILFAAEGEGRNAVFAARQGWTVSAFDISAEGKKKAMQLAATHQVSIDYTVGDLHVLPYQPQQFDAIALIYAHFPVDIKSLYHKTLGTFLRSNGLIIFEAFSKRHLQYLAQNERVGGPKDIAMLFSVEELQSDFAGYEVLELVETEIELHEGLYHNGTGSVIRFVARKK